MIEVELTAEAGDGVECGDPVSVRLRWSGADRSVRELRVVAVAEVVVGDEREVVATSDPPVVVPIDTTADEATFTVTIPAAGPASHDGRLVSVQWRLQSVVDLVRARDTVAEGDPFVVWPSGWRLRAALDEAAPPRNATPPS